MPNETAPTSTTRCRAELLVLKRLFRFVLADLLLGLFDQRFILADERLHAGDLALKHADLAVEVRLPVYRRVLVVPESLEFLFQLRLFLAHTVQLPLELVDLLLRDGGRLLHQRKRRQVAQHECAQHREGKRPAKQFLFHSALLIIRAGICGSPSGCRPRR